LAGGIPEEKENDVAPGPEPAQLLPLEFAGLVAEIPNAVRVRCVFVATVGVRCAVVFGDEKGDEEALPSCTCGAAALVTVIMLCTSSD